MFNTWVDYPTFEEEMNVVKQTTADGTAEVKPVISGDDILAYQQVIRRMPVADNVVDYAVNLAVDPSRRDRATAEVNQYRSWGAGPRLAIPHRCRQGQRRPERQIQPGHRGRPRGYPILRHRVVRNYKAEADGVTVEAIVDRLKYLSPTSPKSMNQRSCQRLSLD